MTGVPIYRKSLTDGSNDKPTTAVAAGVVPVIIGTDIVGSVLNPASFCGLFGHKPSYGRVPYYSQISPFVCAGPIARNVHDAALLLNVPAPLGSRDITALDTDGRDYTQGLDDGVGEGDRFGEWTELGLGPRVDREVAALVEISARIFESLSAGVTPGTTTFETHDITCADRFYQVRALTELTVLPEDVRGAA